VSFDHETFEWVFKVEHFTKWGADDDDDDDEDDDIDDQSHAPDTVEVEMSQSAIIQREDDNMLIVDPPKNDNFNISRQDDDINMMESKIHNQDE
jgi:nuclear pore complex protein Nup98-Nup96